MGWWDSKTNRVIFLVCLALAIVLVAVVLALCLWRRRVMQQQQKESDRRRRQRVQHAVATATNSGLSRRGELEAVVNESYGRAATIEEERLQQLRVSNNVLRDYNSEYGQDATMASPSSKSGRPTRTPSKTKRNTHRVENPTLQPPKATNTTSDIPIPVHFGAITAWDDTDEDSQRLEQRLPARDRNGGIGRRSSTQLDHEFAQTFGSNAGVFIADFEPDGHLAPERSPPPPDVHNFLSGSLPSLNTRQSPHRASSNVQSASKRKSRVQQHHHTQRRALPEESEYSTMVEQTQRYGTSRTRLTDDSDW